MHLGYAVSRRGVPAPASFRRWVAAATAATGRSGARLSLRLVGLHEGRRLNRDYRGRDYATNVLSFPAEAPVESDWLGDIVLCAPVVAREARAQRKPRSEHYAHLTVHGVLHLLGYDHQRARAARTMERLEVQILESIGIQDPYVAR